MHRWVGAHLVAIAERVAVQPDVSRSKDRDHFAVYNGTVPVEVSSGKCKVHRLSGRGNRRVNLRRP